MPCGVAKQMRHSSGGEDHWDTISRGFPQYIGCRGVVLNVGHEGIPPKTPLEWPIESESYFKLLHIVNMGPLWGFENIVPMEISAMGVENME